MKFSYGKYHPLYERWRSMKGRCYCTTNLNYDSYGGRGIVMYEPWITSFKAFAVYIEDNLGPRPDNTVLGRKDINGNFEPGNLYWVTRSQQNLNRRKLTTYANKPLTSPYVGVNYSKVTKNKWRARIVRENKAIHLGYYETEEEANQAVQNYLHRSQ